MSFILTGEEKLALVLLLRRGPCSTLEIARFRGFGYEGYDGYQPTRQLLLMLKVCGAATHAYKRWEITEKGRIAAALLMAKDNELQEVAA